MGDVTQARAEHNTLLQDLEAGTIIGPWRSYAMTEQGYGALMRGVPHYWEPGQRAPKHQAWLQLLHK